MTDNKRWKGRVVLESLVGERDELANAVLAIKRENDSLESENASAIVRVTGLREKIEASLKAQCDELRARREYEKMRRVWLEIRQGELMREEQAND